MNNSSSSAFPWRIIDIWSNPNNGWVRFSRLGTVLTPRAMIKTDPHSPLGRYVVQLREWGFNVVLCDGNPDEHPKAWSNFCQFLKDKGMGMLINRRWADSKDADFPSPDNSDPSVREKFCPYKKATRAYWEKKVEQDFKIFPDIMGYNIRAIDCFYENKKFRNTSFDGAPWMCECNDCKSRTPRERTREAIGLIADLLDKHGAKLLWDTTQDDPWTQRLEVNCYKELTHEIPDNAYIHFKCNYWDFHSRWPLHPLWENIDQDASGRSAFMTTIQSPAEYQGLHDFPWSMVEEWSEVFRKASEMGHQGIVVVANEFPDGWDHPLNMINWFAIATLMRDPQADPQQIKRSWAKEQFGEAAADTVTEVIDKITEAARGIFEFDALWTNNHSRFPTLEYLDSHLCGPYRQVKLKKGMMGFELPLDLYAPREAAEIKANPKTRMVFNSVPITPELKSEMMAQKEEAVSLMEEAIALWQNLKGKIDTEGYEKILEGLEGNRNDAVIFRHGMDIYMDWKLGVLTEEKIDAALEACRGLKGRVVPDALDENPEKLLVSVDPASLKTLAEQLRKDLREHWIDKLWEKNPMGIGFGGVEVQ